MDMNEQEQLRRFLDQRRDPKAAGRSISDVRQPRLAWTFSGFERPVSHAGPDGCLDHQLNRNRYSVLSWTVFQWYRLIAVTVVAWSHGFEDSFLSWVPLPQTMQAR